MADHPYPAEIDAHQFHQCDVRVARVTAASRHPKAAKPAIILTLDLGILGERTSSAQITELYRPEDLVGRLVLALVNVPPRRIAGVDSGALVLGVYSSDGPVVLVGPDDKPGLRPGDRLG
ncbi:MAG: tRNA-binding protein [Planctomycetota bacterium]